MRLCRRMCGGGFAPPGDWGKKRGAKPFYSEAACGRAVPCLTSGGRAASRNKKGPGPSTRPDEAFRCPLNAPCTSRLN